MTLKLATSLDGRIATASGESRWITGEEARVQVHRLRAESDAVVIGIGTALADDPELTVRLPGYTGRQPARVVFDTRQRLPLDSKLVRTAKDIPTYLVARGELSEPLSGAGVRLVPDSPVEEGPQDLAFVFQMLTGQGLENLLVEGGGRLAASLLRNGSLNLFDRIEWFRAPILLGAEGLPCLGGLEFNRLADAPRFRRVSVQALGEDLWERYERL